MTIRFNSHVTIDETARGRIIDGLNQLLAASLDLGSQVKQAHWNVRGDQFFSRHTMFDTLYAHLVASSDLLAERIGQLGGYAEGTVRMASACSKLVEHDVEAVQGGEHVRSLTERYGAMGGMVREQMRTFDELREPVTVDLCTQVLRGLEMDLWFLESHLERGHGVAPKDGADGHRPGEQRAAAAAARSATRS